MHRALFATLALSACSFFGTEEALLPAVAPYESVGRCATEVHPLADGEISPDGLEATAFFDAIAGPRSGTLSFDHTGETTDLEVELVFDRDALGWHESTWVWDDPAAHEGEEPLSDCESFLGVDATMVFVTADGAFDELVPVLVKGGTGYGRVDTVVDYDTIEGSYVPAEIDPASWDTVQVDFAMNISAGTMGGELAVYADRVRSSAEGDSDEGYGNDVARW